LQLQLYPALGAARGPGCAHAVGAGEHTAQGAAIEAAAAGDSPRGRARNSAWRGVWHWVTNSVAVGCCGGLRRARARFRRRACATFAARRPVPATSPVAAASSPGVEG